MDLSLFYLPTWRDGFGISLGRYYEEIIETIIRSAGGGN